MRSSQLCIWYLTCACAVQVMWCIMCLIALWYFSILLQSIFHGQHVHLCILAFLLELELDRKQTSQSHLNCRSLSLVDFLRPQALPAEKCLSSTLFHSLTRSLRSSCLHFLPPAAFSCFPPCSVWCRPSRPRKKSGLRSGISQPQWSPGGEGRDETVHSDYVPALLFSSSQNLRWHK